ncbi:MAG: hypothetical protein ACJ76J_23310 [Thermoanaerobaculia bacterium]
MSEVQRQQASRGMILLVIGGLCILLGLVLFSQRLGLAETFLGAHFLFGIPVSNGDALKVLVVAIGTSILVIKGIVLAVVGLVMFSKSFANQSIAAPETTAASTHR